MKITWILLASIVLIPHCWAYQSESWGFSIQQPPGWRESQNPYVLALFMSQSDGFSPRLSIDVFDNPRSTLQDTVRGIRENCREIFSDFVVLSDRNTTFKDLPAQVLICSWQQGSTEVKMKEIIIRYGRRYYDLAYVASKGQYEHYLPLFQESLSTLSFFDPKYSYLNPDLNLTYPVGWAVDEQTLNNGVIFYGPLEDRFQTNIVLLSETWSGSLDEYLEVQKEGMRETMSNVEILFESQEIIHDLGNRIMEYTYSLPNHSQVKARYEMLDCGEKVLSLIYTSKGKGYQLHLNEFESLVDNIEIPEFTPPFILFSLVFWGLKRWNQ